MKKVILIISIISLLFLGCSSDDKKENDILLNCSDSQSNSKNLYGNWKLIAAEYVYPSDIIDYSNQSIFYNFEIGGLLTVNGSGSGPHTNGEYTFEFILHGIDSEIEYLKINQSMWLYCIQEDIMILDQSHVDGSNLHFKKP